MKLKKTSPLPRRFYKYLSELFIKEWLSGGHRALQRQYRILKEKYPEQVDAFLMESFEKLETTKIRKDLK